MNLLNYKICYVNTIQQILRIDATLPCTDTAPLKLFKGKVKLLSFECNCPYRESDPYIIVEGNHHFIHLSYTVQIGSPGKHGFYGTVQEALTVFAGEQVFLFPTPLMLAGNFAPAATISGIEITYDFPNALTCLAPFKNTHTTSSCLAPKWCDVYELLKSTYVFSGLESLATAASPTDSLHIYRDLHIEVLEPDTIQNIENLFKYYADLFKLPNHPLTLILLDSKPESILGGCGRHVICSSFDPHTLRDWQLLAHRIFHSFMDTALPLSDFHMPPNLWLTEGLATYYENVALGALSDPLKEKLGLHITKEFNRLYTRYLYAKLKASTPFDFPPMAEKYIRSTGKLEFLHYTHAPLIVKYIEDTFATPPGHPHIMLRTLLRLGSHEAFSIQNFFTLILGQEVDAFAQNFLFRDNLLPLWYLSSAHPFTTEELIEDLNYFEYLLYSWLILEDATYRLTPLSSNALETQCIIAEQHQIAFAPPNLEEKIKQYALPLYQVLKSIHIPN